MELAIREKKENASLGRQEIACEVSFEKAMPSRKQLREALAASLGAAPELLVIVSAKGSFGTSRAAVAARLYNSKEAMAVERKYLLVRDGLAEKEKKAAAAKAAPAKK